ncbi:type II toxin-antitoxin system PemK/MazF family toxin [Dyadobacter bucti]|uniref:type II toxin-antitoxin system PemK/MazF family toxin n=1 Tax=Dyadobacter bucti TaxID=2572203 RepID=UPI003F70547E
MVVIPFPFSDLSGSKRRPAMVLADLDGDDILLCQITSQNTRDSRAVPITNQDFQHGSLPVSCYIRPTRIFTADKNIIVRATGILKPQIVTDVVQSIISVIS